ncbi:hypothetical protein INP78_06510 [Methylophilus sp. 14]|nr:hypothetical protein [Methylophilus sp. 14]
MFEADAEQFRKAGIRVGADQREVEQSLFEEVLSPFSVDTRNEALSMSRLYALLYCFENSVRALILERLSERYGATWWGTKVPRKIRDFAEQRIKDALDNSWLEGQSRDPLGFIQFGHLADIICENWVDFSDLIPSQHWLKQRMDELEKARNFLAHNRLLLSSEFQRIEMYVNDWNRQVGL